MSEVTLRKIEKMIYEIRGHKAIFDSDLESFMGLKRRHLQDKLEEI